ncbi:MAG: protein kinase, partial [Acidobacteriota bacterium]
MCGWAVRPALNQLEFDGETRRIEGRAMAVLVELVLSSGQLCSKRRLIKAVWGESFVSDEVLTHAISELRKAFGDEPRNPRFIQTVPRKGYRLIAPVEWLEEAGGGAAESTFPYRILEKIGGGGMGLVYRAEDSRLHRIVALKFLPPNLVSDSKARARLWREARAAAALEHRNIATVFDVGVDPQGQTYLTMAYYPGQTLREKIEGGPLSVVEACHYARQTAEGLAAAHVKGILHRDIKPANVLITAGDEVKIVDFGLAKSVTDPGLTITNPGVTPGTVLYMSPESLSGEDVDLRSDLWSLGVVLYEMLAGSPPFSGDSIPVATHSILHDRIQRPRALRPEIPVDLERLVLDLLQRDPRLRPVNAERVVDRLASIFGSDAFSLPAERWQLPWGHWVGRLLASAKHAWRRLARPVAWSSLGAIAASALWLSQLGRTSTGATSRQALAFDLRPPSAVGFAGGVDSSAAVSRDGEWVVFIGEDEAGKREPWSISLDGRSEIHLSGAERPGQPFWSPDGRYIGFFDANRLKTQALDGGPPVELARVSSEFRGGSWGTLAGNEVIVFAPGSRQGLSLVQIRNGLVETLTTPDRSRDEIGHLWPQVLENGEQFIYFVSSNDRGIRGIYLRSLEENLGRKILDTSASAIMASGHLLYLSESSLMARPFDVERVSFSGPASLVTEGVSAFFTYQGAFSASSTGVLVYSNEFATVGTLLRQTDFQGRELGVLTHPGAYRNPTLSRDSRNVVV